MRTTNPNMTINSSIYTHLLEDVAFAKSTLNDLERLFHVNNYGDQTRESLACNIRNLRVRIRALGEALDILERCSVSL